MVADFLTHRQPSGLNPGPQISPVYRVLIAGRIRGGGREIRVIAQTPEEIGIQIDNEWEALVANGEIPIPATNNRAANLVGVGADFAARASGITRSNQGLTSQIWRGTSPLEIQLPLLLNAQENAYNDVVVPMRNLLQLASPYRLRGGSFLGYDRGILGNLIHAPGPTLLDVVRNSPENNIRLDIGRILNIPSVVITSLQFDIPNRFTREGHPIEANINVSLRTHFTYLRDDYERIFGSGRLTSPSRSGSSFQAPGPIRQLR